MNLDCFLKRFSQILLSDDNDATFQAIKMMAGGLTAPRIGKLINFAVSQMNKDECYVETGVFSGCTLISANWANSKTCIGIDSFGANLTDATSSPAQEVIALCRANVSGMAAGARLIEKDFRDVTKDEIGKPVAVAFIDAKHTREDVKENLEWLEPLLAEQAVILFDDVNCPGVNNAIIDWYLDHATNYDLVCHIKPYYQNEAYISSVADRILNNGVSVLVYHR